MEFDCPASNTDTTFLHVDGLVINSDTGEIFGYDDASSVFSERPDYKPELSKCRSVDDFNAFLKHVDRRYLPAHALHSLISAQDEALGVWFRSSRNIDCRITKPMMETLKKLHKLVVYHNVIFTSQAGLSKALKTEESNVIKKLKTLVDSNMVRVITSKAGTIRKGEIKLTINPRLVFCGDDYAKARYVEGWYLTPKSTKLLPAILKMAA